MSSESENKWWLHPFWLAGALVALSPVAFSTRVENSFGLPRLLLLAIAAALTSGSLWTWYRTAPTPTRRLWLARAWPAMAWLAWIILTTLAQRPTATAIVALASTLLCVVPFLAFTTGACPPIAMRRLLAGAVTVAALQSGYALLQWLNFDPLFAHATHALAGTQATQRIIGTIGYQNTLGEYLALLLPITLWLGASARHRRWRITWPALAALMFVAVLLTRSRGATLAALLGVATAQFLALRLPPSGLSDRQARRPTRALAYSAALAVLLALLVAGLTRGEGDSALHQRLRNAFHPQSPALLQRALVWRVTAHMLPGNWLQGQGLGAFAHNYLHELGTFLDQPEHAHLRPFALNVKEAHNDYLQMLAEAGLVGLGLWGLVLGSAWRRLLSRAPAACPSSQDPRFCAAIAGSMVAFMVAGLVSFPLHVLPVAPLFWLLLGAGLAPATAAAPVSHLPTPLPTSRLLVRGAAGLAPVLIACITTLAGDSRFLRGRAAAADARWPEALRNYAAAERLLPLNARLRFFHGSAHLAAGQPESARAAFAAAAAGGFSDLNLWRNQARAELALNRPAQAVVLLQRAAATCLHPDDVLPELAGALVRAGQPQAAVAALQKMPRYAAETEEAAGIVARDLLSLNQIEPAIALLTPLTEAIRSRPDERAALLEILGMARLMQGDPLAAEALLRDATRLAPENLSAQNNLGAALQLQGRIGEAVSTWQAVLREDPTNAIALRNLQAHGAP